MANAASGDFDAQLMRLRLGQLNLFDLVRRACAVRYSSDNFHNILSPEYLRNIGENGKKPV
jgi:hypothetical protein